MRGAQAEKLITLSFELGRALRHRMTVCVSGEVNLLQLHGLAFIGEHPGITMKEFAAKLKITSPSATSFVGRLVRLKLVRRVRDPENRKLVRLALTPAGQRMVHINMQRRRREIARLLSRLSEHDQRELVKILAHLKRALSQHMA